MSPKGSTLDTPDTALATATPQSMSQYAATDTRGKESFGSEDVEIPKIKVAQKTSPEIEDGHGSRIEGLKFTEMFNSLTGEIYGKGPLNIVVIRHAKNAVLFDKKTQKAIERNVPLDDDRLKFGANGEKPSATLFHSYLVLLPDTGDTAILSLKSSGIKAAKRLNAQLSMLKGPIWSAVFTVSTVTESFESGPAGVMIIGRGGQTPPDIAEMAESLYERTGDFMARADKKAEAAPVDPDDISF